MQLGCFQSNHGLHQIEFASFVEQVALLGYTAIDMPLNVPDAAAIVRQHGLHIHSAGALHLPDLSPDATVQEEIARRATAAIESCARFQIPTITTVIGRAPGYNGEENIALFSELFTPLAAHAEAKGVKFAFENWPRGGTMLATTPEMWDAMFTAVPSTAIGLCYDPSHFYWQGIEYLQPIYDFGDRIVHAHAKDTEIIEKGRNRYGIYGRQLAATAEADWWRYRLPGYGAVNWYRYLDALVQIGYEGVLSVEHEDPVWSETPELALRGLRLAYAFLAPLIA
ncbi:MAG: sugar phosphate isomerase/epimerase family protein [Caldilinea sp.]|jgi:sugar phosphate isomerase/epimerase